MARVLKVLFEVAIEKCRELLAFLFRWLLSFVRRHFLKGGGFRGLSDKLDTAEKILRRCQLFQVGFAFHLSFFAMTSVAVGCQNRLHFFESDCDF